MAEEANEMESPRIVGNYVQQLNDGSKHWITDNNVDWKFGQSEKCEWIWLVYPIYMSKQEKDVYLSNIYQADNIYTRESALCVLQNLIEYRKLTNYILYKIECDCYSRISELEMQKQFLFEMIFKEKNICENIVGKQHFRYYKESWLKFVDSEILSKNQHSYLLNSGNNDGIDMNGLYGINSLCLRGIFDRVYIPIENETFETKRDNLIVQLSNKLNKNIRADLDNLNEILNNTNTNTNTRFNNTNNCNSVNNNTTITISAISTISTIDTKTNTMDNLSENENENGNETENEAENQQNSTTTPTSISNFSHSPSRKNRRNFKIVPLITTDTDEGTTDDDEDGLNFVQLKDFNPNKDTPTSIN